MLVFGGVVILGFATRLEGQGFKKNQCRCRCLLRQGVFLNSLQFWMVSHLYLFQNSLDLCSMQKEQVTQKYSPLHGGLFHGGLFHGGDESHGTIHKQSPNKQIQVPVSKLATMVGKSPIPGVVPLPNGHSWPINPDGPKVGGSLRDPQKRSLEDPHKKWIT